MRLDRSFTLALFAPLQRIRREGSTALPVLMYHSISDDTESARSPYYKVCTSPQRFSEQMCWLADAGYRGVTLREGLALLDSAPACAAQTVAITFDDGFADFHRSAVPVLQRHRFSATMYLPTAFIGTSCQAFNRRVCMTWSQVRELATLGVELGSHTVNHSVLYRLPWDRIQSEIEDSKSRIEDMLSSKISTFAYPYAFPQHDAKFVKRFGGLLARAGYASCATTVIGRVKPTDNRYSLKRLPVNTADDRQLLAAKLAGAYDWLSAPQALLKRLGWLFRRPTECRPLDRNVEPASIR